MSSPSRIDARTDWVDYMKYLPPITEVFASCQPQICIPVEYRLVQSLIVRCNLLRLWKDYEEAMERGPDLMNDRDDSVGILVGAQYAIPRPGPPILLSMYGHVSTARKLLFCPRLQEFRHFRFVDALTGESKGFAIGL